MLLADYEMLMVVRCYGMLNSHDMLSDYEMPNGSNAIICIFFLKILLECYYLYLLFKNIAEVPLNLFHSAPNHTRFVTPQIPV